MASTPNCSIGPWSSRRDSNSQPTLCKSVALPLRHSRGAPHQNRTGANRLRGGRTTTVLEGQVAQESDRRLGSGRPWRAMRLPMFRSHGHRLNRACVRVSRRGSPGCRSRTSWASTMRASFYAKEPAGWHMWRCQPCLLVHYGVFKEQVGLRKVPGKKKTPDPDSGGGLVLLKTVVVRPWHRRIRLNRAAVACGFQARGTHRCGYCRSIALLTVVSQWFLSLGESYNPLYRHHEILDTYSEYSMSIRLAQAWP